MKGSLVMFLLLMCLSAGVMKASDVGKNPLNVLHKGGLFRANSRKLMEFHDVLDYDTGPNPKHDPRGGKRGGAAVKGP